MVCECQLSCPNVLGFVLNSNFWICRPVDLMIASAAIDLVIVDGEEKKKLAAEDGGEI